MNAGQSKRGSLVESLANIVVGVVVAFVSQLAIFGYYGIHVPLVLNAKMTAFFTLVSLVRSFVLRRVFNKITTRKTHETQPVIGQFKRYLRGRGLDVTSAGDAVVARRLGEPKTFRAPTYKELFDKLLSYASEPTIDRALCLRCGAQGEPPWNNVTQDGRCQ